MTLGDEVRELLTGRSYAHVATVMPDGSPQNSAVWIGVEGDDIVFTKEAGSVAVRNLRRDPRVAISIVDGANPFRFARIRGRAVEIRDDAAAAAQLTERLARRYTDRPYPQPLADGVTIVVRPERVHHEVLEEFAPPEH
jgi:PPOX class probable F420-dependent enzyme